MTSIPFPGLHVYFRTWRKHLQPLCSQCDVRCQLGLGLSSIPCIYLFISLLSVFSWWMEPTYIIKSSLMFTYTSNQFMHAFIDGQFRQRNTSSTSCRRSSWSISAQRSPDWKNLPRFLHLHSSYRSIVIIIIHFNFQPPSL